MYRVFISTIFSFLLTFSAHAQYRGYSNDEIEVHAKLLNMHAEAVFDKAKIGLLSLSKIIQRSELSQREGHELFSEITQELDGVRAIIFIRADGQLEYDSFSYPTPDVNLSSREYFVNAKNSSGSGIIIGKPVIGKTSNIPFLPIAMRVEKNDTFIGILTAIITPSVLVQADEHNGCLHCVSLLTDLSGNIIADHPQGLQLSNDFKQKLNATSRPVRGAEVLQLENLKARIYWIRNEEYPYISIFLEFKRG